MKFKERFFCALACLALCAGGPALCREDGADDGSIKVSEPQSAEVGSDDRYTDQLPADSPDSAKKSVEANIAENLKQEAAQRGYDLDNSDIKSGEDAVNQMLRSVSGQSEFDIDDVSKSFTLEKSINYALENNPEVKNADENIVQAGARYRQAQSMKNLQFTVGNRLTYQPKGVSGGIVTNDPLANSLTASLKALLTTFGRVENQIAAAYLEIGVESLNAMSVRRELVYQVKQAFFNRVKAGSNVDAALLNADLCKQSLVDADKMYKSGVMALYDVIQANLQITDAEEQLAQANTSLDSADAEFFKLLALNNPTADRYSLHVISPPPIEVDPQCTVADLKKLAAARRYELLSLDRSIEVLKKSREAAEANNRPEIYLSADYIFSPGYHTLPCSNYQLNLNINWNAWDGGAKNAQLDEIDSQIDALTYSRESLCDTIYLDVEKAWLNFNLTDITMKTTKNKVESAWVFHEMARQRFLNGLGTSLEVQQALTSLNNARLSFISACCDRELAFAALEYSVGVDFPNRRLSVTPELLKAEEID
ncbi:TolC family protein [bacterium]|nr:TolC family protein [bacterium]